MPVRAEADTGSPSARIIVRYAEAGPHAVEACGARLHALGDHRAGTRDGSDSLDRLRERFGVQRVRPLTGGAPAARGARALSPGESVAPLEARRARVRDLSRRAWSRRRERTAAERQRANPSTSASTVRARAGSAGASATDALLARASALAHVYQLELAPGESAAEAARAYAADPHVVWAQVDAARALDAHAPDPFLESFGSWDQPYEDLWGHHRIRAQDAWDTTRGEGVVVGVVDTGLDWHHPDIAENVFVHPGEDLNGNGRVDAFEWNGVDDDGNGFVDDLVGFDFANSIDANGDGDYLDPGDWNDPDPFDDHGHGSHVAGIIAAVADNGEGIAGVAPGARIMALKGFKADGENSDALLWRAVLYAALNGASVVNNSWSCGAPCPRNPLAEEVVELVHALGVTIVTSAGNKSRDVAAFSPENMWQTITVGSSDVADRPSASFTNQGFGIDVFAPGGDPQDTPGVFVPRRNILSLRSSASDPVEDAFEVGGGYIRLAGTSMAAPQVAGVAALLYAQRPGIGPDVVRRIVRRSAVDLGEPGYDWESGAGRLDAASAVAEPPEPDWLLRVTSPRTSAWRDPRDGPVEIRGTASGPDLRRYEVAVGAGIQPTSWTTIVASEQPVEDGVLAEWSVDEETIGASVIRVEAESIDGRTAIEHVPMSFERLELEVLSSDGPEAQRPAIHGRRVVWTTRRGDVEDEAGRLDHEIYEAGFGGLSERRLISDPAGQTQPGISADRHGRTYTWLHEVEGVPPVARACRVAGRRGGECVPGDIGGPLGQTTAPVPIRDSVYWIDSVPGEVADNDVFACRFDSAGGPCVPIESGLVPARRGFVDGDGRGTLAWIAASDGLRIATCEVDSDGRCDEMRLPPGERAFTRPAASRGLVAWVAGRLFGRRPLLACRPDVDGWCTPVQILRHADDDRVRVSGDLVVWDGAVGDEPGDVFFCEFDPHLQRCPVQRLTSEGSLQDEAVVDGRRVVWIDERFGPGRVVGVELPRWRAPGSRRAHVGRPMKIVAWLDEAGHGSAEVAVETTIVSGDAVAAVAPRVELRAARADRRLANVTWCPTEADIGEQVWTLHAKLPDGISTRASFTVEIEPPRPEPRWAWLWRLLGLAPPLRTCEAAS